MNQNLTINSLVPVKKNCQNLMNSELLNKILKRLICVQVNFAKIPAEISA